MVIVVAPARPPQLRVYAWTFATPGPRPLAEIGKWQTQARPPQDLARNLVRVPRRPSSLALSPSPPPPPPPPLPRSEHSARQTR